MKIAGLILIFCSLFLSQSFAQKDLPVGYQYLFPGVGAKYVHPKSTIVLRLKKCSPYELSNLNSCIIVRGDESGTHSGKTAIASDKRTLIFKPEKNYVLGEKVKVSIEPKISGNAIQPLQAFIYEFTVLEKEISKKSVSTEKNHYFPDLKNAEVVKPQIMPQIMPNGVSVPADFPHVNITQNNNPSGDYIFVNTMIKPYYNIIFNTSGEPVWYQKTVGIREDFRVQSNGWISMQNGKDNDESEMGHIAFSQNFEYIKSFHASNGYTTDEHEFYMLPDSGYFLIGKRETKVDMSQYVADGDSNATVEETCIQEFTAKDELIFIWRAWDHFDIRDVELADLTSSYISFPHMNAIFTDDDGHILLSSRHLSEISKIHRRSGEFIWRMSGNQDSQNNDFQFVDDPLNGFRNQHAIRSLGNNRYTLLDNGNLHDPPVSRAVEYEIDVLEMSAKLVWEYRHALSTRIARFMGNVQRLPNGNTHINWAVNNLPHVAMEITPEDMIEFEMNFKNGANCYRSFRHTWEGKCLVPYLLLEPQPDNLTLIFNKFGDEDVDYYNIYGGTSPNPGTLVDTCHSTLKQITGLENGQSFYFRVSAVDKSGVESGFSNEESINVNLVTPGKNIIKNGDFANGLYAWNRKTDRLVLADIQIVDGVCTFEVQNGGQDYKDVQLNQDSILLIKGQKYILEFDGWADEFRIMEIKLTQEDSPALDYSRIGYTALSSTKKRFRYSFEMQESTDNNSQLQINAGASDMNLYIDKLSLIIDAEPSTVLSLTETSRFLLTQNYPNPFSQSTTISYTIPDQSNVALVVFDGLGRVLDVLVNKVQAPGNYLAEFNSTGLDNGVYYYKITAGAFMQTNKMLLLR